MANITSQVQQIIQKVRTRGDAALCELTRRFDHIRIRPSDLRVSASELKGAKQKVSAAYLKTIKECAKNIEAFAKLEKRRMTPSWLQKVGSIRMGQQITPVDSVGLYIPGGRFPYPSTVLMTAIPARVAGVKKIILASPAKNLTPEVLAAAELAGIDSVFRIGGPGAIAAFAYGTKRIPQVDFIVGPGNQYVTEAKRQVYGQVGIDSLAGPSEVVIIADRTTPANYVLLDLSAQAEHDPEARSRLLSTDANLIKRVRSGLNKDIARRVRFQKVSSLNEAMNIANQLAPEHLELLFKGSERYLSKARHAGAIFLGPSTPAALGDYVAGPSHVLPTNRAARFSSGLSVATFYKRSSVIGFEGRTSEKPLWEAALVMGQTEGMEYHSDSLRCRMSA